MRLIAVIKTFDYRFHVKLAKNTGEIFYCITRCALIFENKMSVKYSFKIPILRLNRGLNIKLSQKAQSKTRSSLSSYQTNLYITHNSIKLYSASWMKGNNQRFSLE